LASEPLQLSTRASVRQKDVAASRNMDELDVAPPVVRVAAFTRSANAASDSRP
jgi:hypothetical protein